MGNTGKSVTWYKMAGVLWIIAGILTIYKASKDRKEILAKAPDASLASIYAMILFGAFFIIIGYVILNDKKS